MADTVFVNDLSVIHKGSPGKSVAFPDVNLCPPSPPAGPVPAPLPNVAQAADLAGAATTVFVGGNPVAKKSSYFARSTGNAVARSTGGGVMTHVVEGPARFIGHAMTVMIEGEPVPRHLDTMTHNHAGMPGEAVGTYLGSMSVSLVGSPFKEEPKERSEKEREPVTYEICVKASAWKSAKQNYRLRSDDGSYDQIGAEAGRKGKDLVRVAFKKVLPGKRYSLFLEQGGEQLLLLNNIPFVRLLDHTAPGQRPRKRIIRAPKLQKEAASVAASNPSDPLYAEQAGDDSDPASRDPHEDQDE